MALWNTAGNTILPGHMTTLIARHSFTALGKKFPEWAIATNQTWILVANSFSAG